RPDGVGRIRCDRARGSPGSSHRELSGAAQRGRRGAGSRSGPVRHAGDAAARARAGAGHYALMLRRALASLALLLAAAPALAQDAAEWLARMRQALVEVDYQGELVYVHGNQVEALRIFHAAGPD